MIPYDQFVTIFPSDSESGNDDGIRRYLQNRRLTHEGVEYVVEWIDDQAKAKHWNKEVSTVLWVGQQLGGLEFVKRFNAFAVGSKSAWLQDNVKDVWNASDTSPSAGSEETLSLSPRRSLISSDSSAEAAFDIWWARHEDSGLFLNMERCIALDLMALVDSTKFADLCSESGNAMWALRWINRMGVCVPPDDTATVELLARLPESSQGALLAELWTTLIHADSQTQSLDQLLSIHRALPLRISLTIVARVLSQPTAVSGGHASRNSLTIAQREEIVIQIARWWDNVGMARDDIARYFVRNLYDRVSQTPLVVCLDIADHVNHASGLDTYLRQCVIEEYLRIWRKLNRDGYHFQAQTIGSLIQGLAAAMVATWGSSAFERLSRTEGIPSLRSRDNAVRRHEYAQIIESCGVSLVHAVLTTEVLKALVARGVRIDPSLFQGFVKFVIEVSKCSDSMRKRTEVEVELYGLLMKNLGFLFSRPGYAPSYESWNRWIIRPDDISALMVDMSDTEQSEVLTQALWHNLVLIRYELTDQELISMAGRIFIHGHFHEVSYLLSCVSTPDKQPPMLQAYWRRLYSTALVQEAARASSRQQQIELLEAALKKCRTPIAMVPHDHENAMLELQIVGWLHDRDAIPVNDLRDVFLRTQKFYPTLSDSPAERYLVYALTWARILGMDPVDDNHNLLDRIFWGLSDVDNQVGTVALLRCWHAHLKEQAPDEQWVEVVRRYGEELESQSEWLPSSLTKQLEEVLRTHGD